MAKKTTYDLAIQHAMTAAANAKDIANLSVPVRTVALVHVAQGVLDNGGLQYFFESDFPGTPDYAHFLEAYRAIGAHDAATTLSAAVHLFPFDSPHKKRERRNEFLDSFLGEDDTPANSPFEPLSNLLCGNKDVWEKLRLYIGAHTKDFGGRG